MSIAVNEKKNLIRFLFILFNFQSISLCMCVCVCVHFVFQEIYFVANCLCCCFLISSLFFTHRPREYWLTRIQFLYCKEKIRDPMRTIKTRKQNRNVHTSLPITTYNVFFGVMQPFLFFFGFHFDKPKKKFELKTHTFYVITSSILFCDNILSIHSD